MLSKKVFIGSSLGFGCIILSTVHQTEMYYDTYTIFEDKSFKRNPRVGRYGFKIPFTYTVSVPTNKFYRVVNPVKYHINYGNGSVEHTLLESLFLTKPKMEKFDIEHYVESRLNEIEFNKKCQRFIECSWFLLFSSYLIPMLCPLVAFYYISLPDEKVKGEILELIIEDKEIKESMEKIGIEIDFK